MKIQQKIIRSCKPTEASMAAVWRTGHSDDSQEVVFSNKRLDFPVTPCHGSYSMCVLIGSR